MRGIAPPRGRGGGGGGCGGGGNSGGGAAFLGGDAAAAIKGHGRGIIVARRGGGTVDGVREGCSDGGRRLGGCRLGGGTLNTTKITISLIFFFGYKFFQLKWCRQRRKSLFAPTFRAARRQLL